MEIQNKLEIIAQAPAIVQEMIAEIPTELLKQRRISGKWSIHEHACHLAEAEKMLLSRFRRFKAEKYPVFTPYLPGTTVADDVLMEMDLNFQLESYADNRRQMVSLLQGFTASDWANEGSHPEYTQYTPFILLRHIMLHDYFHAYRIEELWLTNAAFLV